MAIDKLKRLFLPISIGYMFFLYLVSSLPGTEGPENILSSVPSFFQNLLHIPAFGILTLLWILTLKTYHYRDRMAISLAIALVAIYGAGLEYYQAFVPGRYASIIDFMLNLAGAVTFSLIYYLFITTQVQSSEVHSSRLESCED